jgi:hypothetical protein
MTDHTAVSTALKAGTPPPFDDPTKDTPNDATSEAMSKATTVEVAARWGDVFRMRA